ncbi:MAG TPA: ABC transporter permease, partial [Gemmataceae bacterium]|nr:ABC transporter permease [Gemmataceae bacterium]
SAALRARLGKRGAAARQSTGCASHPAMLDWLEHLGRFTHFVLRGLVAALLAPLRPRELLAQLYQVLLGILPLGLVAGLAIGAVLWLQLHGIFRRFQAEQYLPQALALAVVLEFAPIAAGLLLAGRAGASLGAELGSMRLTEQIDALEVLGLSPMANLVGPRVLACMLTMPLLTVFIAYLAVGAGFLAEAAGGSMSARQYLNETLRVLTLQDAVPAVLKTTVFGYLIGVTGCYFGMEAKGGTEGVGRAATRGVVVSLFLVLVADVVLVRVIQAVTAALAR